MRFGYHQQPNGNDGCYRGPSAVEKALQDNGIYRFKICDAGDDRVGIRMDQAKLDQFPEKTGPQQRLMGENPGVEQSPPNRMAVGAGPRRASGKRAL